MTKADLQRQIDELRDRLDALTGKPRGPISMTEARIANERGDVAIVNRFNQQENERINRERRCGVNVGQAAGNNS